MKCFLTVFKKPLQSKVLLAMKLTVVLTLVFTLNVSAKGFGQETISLRVKKTEISGVLRFIEKQTTYRFLYNDKLEDIREKVSVNVKEATLDEVLKIVLDRTRLSYQLMENNLVIIKEDPNTLRIPDVTIHGRVTGEGGAPLIGASIQIKGTTTGTFTNNTGSFTITAPNANVTLIVSSVGYEQQEINLAGRTDVTIALITSTKVIDQVVVTGYGTASKRDLTGSIVKVAGKDVADKPNTNPVASLQGKVAGLSVVNNGTPGDAPDIRIRGTISIGSVSPLYVVDGIFNDNINYLNPNDIESIDILKDPSSLAIFGVRGAAGVIAITTKKAKTGQTIINFNSSYGFKKLVDKIELADADQFKTLFEEEKANLNTPIAPFDYTPWTANTDWIDAVTRTGQFNTDNISVAGSTEKNKFTMGAGYTYDEGIIRHEKLEKITFSFNDEFKLSKAIKVGFNFNGLRQNNPYYNARFMLDEARKVIPIVPAGTKTVFTKNPYGIDSTYQNLYYELPSIQNSGVVNPLIQLENEWDKTKSIEYRTVGSIWAEINFTKNFNFKSTIYADLSNVNTRVYTPLYNSYDVVTNSVFLVSPKTRVTEEDDTYRKFQQDHILTYKGKIGRHNITSTAGFTTYYYGAFLRSASVNQSSTGAAIPDDKRFWFINNGFGDLQSQRSSSDQYERTTVSGLVRLLYNYDRKYYINGSFRHDGSSQISPRNRWQDFWAVGAAWELTRENFMSSQRIFDFVKIKGSMGILGNQNTYGYNYPFYPGLRTGAAAVFGNNIYNAYSQAYLPDPNLKWESVHSKDFGVELSALKNRLHFDGDYYVKKTENLMTYIPGINGASDGLSNIGSIKNNGVELTASWEQRFNRDLTLTVSGNLTTYHNVVLELATKDFAIINGYNRTVVGEPIGSFYGYIVEGIYQTYADKLASPVNTEFFYGPGDLKYKDINGDGKINTLDKTFIGNPTPDFTYGVSVNLNYKGFDLGLDFNGVYGNEIYRNWGGTESPFQRINYAAFKINRWHGEGTSNWDPILGQDHRINYESSTYGIEDGSYFRIRNLQVGYNFPQKLISRITAKNLRLFANVQNLKTWKHNSGYTPEFGGSATSFGVDNAGGAIPVITTFGINVTF